MLLVDIFGCEEPALSFKKLESGLQFLVLVRNHRTYDVTCIPDRAALQASGTVFQLLEELGIAVHRPLHQQQRAGRTFLTGVAKSRAAGVHDGMVAVALGRKNHHVLSTRLGAERFAGIGVGEGLSRICAACQNDVLHHGRRGQQLLAFCVGHDELQRLLWYACFVECLDEQLGHGRSYGGGLQDTRVTCGQGGYDTSNGYGAREVPWGYHEHGAFCLHVDVGQCSELLHRGRVEATVVDGLADLHIGLLDGLACDSTHTAAEVAAHLTEAIGHGVHQLVTLLNRFLPPP